MIRTSYICATAMLTLNLVACSRSSSPSTPTQDSTVQNGPSIPTQNSGGVPTTDLARDLSGVPQVFRQSVGRPDPEGTPFNRIRPQGITPVTSVVFDVVAHADDWELFMNPDTYAQVNQPNTKNVFIYTTAGDGGAGSGPDPLRPYYVSREDGANRTLRFVANVTPGFSEATVVTKVRIRGHTIRKVTYKNTVSYFLRLSDGAPDGQGYAPQGAPVGFVTESLQHLYEGKITSMTAVDQSTTYLGWDDLKQTVAGIVSNEAIPIGRALVNLTETDQSLNTTDHSDHFHTSLLVKDSLKNKNCVSYSYFLTYDMSGKPTNVSSEEIINQAAVVGVMESGKGDSGYVGSWESFHKSFIGKHYSRQVPATSTSTCL